MKVSEKFLLFCKKNTISFLSVFAVSCALLLGAGVVLAQDARASGIEHVRLNFNILDQKLKEASDPIVVHRGGHGKCPQLHLELMGPREVSCDEKFCYLVKLCNKGPGHASWVDVTNLLPRCFKYVSHLATAGDFNPKTGRWSNLVLKAGACECITLTVRAKEYCGGQKVVVCPSSRSDCDMEKHKAYDPLSVCILPCDPELDLDLTVSNPHPPCNGEIQYFICTRNISDKKIENIEIVLSLPSPLIYVSDNFSGTDEDGVVTFPPFTLYPNMKQKITVTVFVPQEAGKMTLQASAFASFHGDEKVVYADSSKACITVQCCTPGEIVVTKESSGDPCVVAGGEIKYTISVLNNTPNPVFGIQVVDNFPSVIDNISWTRTVIGGISGDDTGVGNLDDLIDLNAGSEAIYEVFGTVNGNLEGDEILVNIASVIVMDGNECESFHATNKTCVDREVEIQVLKVAGSEQVVPGTEASFVIEVHNLGPSDAFDILVTDNFPEELIDPEWTRTIIGGGSPNGAGVGDIIDFIDLNAGATARYDIIGTVDPILGDDCDTKRFCNLVDVEFEGEHKIAEACVEVIIPEVFVCLEKSVFPEIFTPGSSGIYTIVVTNRGENDAFGIKVVDPLDPKFVGPICSRVTSFDPSLNYFDVPCLGGLDDTIDIPSGGSVVYTIVGTIAAWAKGEVINTAKIVYRKNICCENKQTLITPIAPQADIGVEKKLLTNPILAGGNITYEIEVINFGPNDAESISFTDNLPDEIEMVSWTAHLIPQNGGSLSQTMGVGDIDVTIDLNVGARAIFTVNGKIIEEAQGSIVNTAKVLYPNDPNPCNDCSTNDTPVIPLADICIEKVGSPKPFLPGKEGVYTISVTNNGPSDASDVHITDSFPNAFMNPVWEVVVLQNAAVENMQGSGDIDEFIDIDVGGLVVYEVTGTIAPKAIEAIVNIAHATYPNDPDSCNNWDKDRTEVTFIDLKLEVEVTPNPPCCDEPTFFFAKVTNCTEDATATGVVVRDLLPLGVQYVPGSAQASPGTAFHPFNGTWTIGDLEGTESKHLRFEVAFAPFAQGEQVSGSAKVTFNMQQMVSAKNIAAIIIDVPDCKPVWD